MTFHWMEALTVLGIVVLTIGAFMIHTGFGIMACGLLIIACSSYVR